MIIVRYAALAALFALPVAAMAAPTAVQPGQWEVLTTVEAVDIPGAPPAVAAMMKRKPVSVKYCITPEEAARGPQDMMKSDKSCRFTRYAMAGGKLSSEMVCTQSGATVTATREGSFTPTGFNLRARTVMSGAQTMTMTATTVGRRIGECRK
jgi:hypothetical protein